jgi:hypothetical protein
MEAFNKKVFLVLWIIPLTRVSLLPLVKSFAGFYKMGFRFFIDAKKSTPQGLTGWHG